MRSNAVRDTGVTGAIFQGQVALVATLAYAAGTTAAALVASNDGSLGATTLVAAIASVAGALLGAGGIRLASYCVEKGAAPHAAEARSADAARSSSSASSASG